MAIEIIQIGITEAQESTWGRVYIDYKEDGVYKFAFKNWIKFEERNFDGNGSFGTEPAYTWFKSRKVTTDYMAVLEGEYDNLFLTADRYKSDYGTPSKILIRLINDLDRGLMEDINNRRGWFN
ncbi:hypothetical protein [Fluviicola taffensis]|uniref:Uncharacterized protein n=1 Tax=Fluviicola taffensis (strain DSM 16823 / NCIMB 13979 / RW262) TaxID=755732 RepID=F2IGS8_FLUTR|nr:hypothetical protein [Fluviicola taffensis]AEA43695.1 hypothetical protein Fluta_1703 [Fluviicola taffensis DSM 16823]